MNLSFSFKYTQASLEIGGGEGGKESGGQARRCDGKGKVIQAQREIKYVSLHVDKNPSR